MTTNLRLTAFSIPNQDPGLFFTPNVMWDGEAPAPVEEKKLATWGTDVPDDLVLDQKLLVDALKKEDERKKEERDERKRKYNVKWDDEVTVEDMEAYRMKKIHHDDPMKDFLH
ncbi:hypothetical protein AAG906_022048 [Vitis piasezkii]|uniref:Pre-mRNA-splicing factor SLU7 n=1 Tax=Vitis vinifera TaxID=29760 RepID=A0A438DD62_VITVI|nr:Pre-mRNA-splicing factor SLU7 [Vitis vinifera]RVW86786.1 Pre-mRNA-splicing factor SLU7 [Vitis vinifera]